MDLKTEPTGTRGANVEGQGRRRKAAEVTGSDLVEAVPVMHVPRQNTLDSIGSAGGGVGGERKGRNRGTEGGGLAEFMGETGQRRIVGSRGEWDLAAFTCAPRRG